MSDTPERYAGAADAHLDLRHHLSYADYLGLDAVLTAQRPRTDAHDEMLFIVQHQATELWLKLVLHELHTVAALVDADDLGPAFKSFARVERVMQGLIASWDVLSTMTPADYMAFRAALDTSSGFQSFQFRELEFVLGNRNAVYLEPFRHEPQIVINGFANRLIHSDRRGRWSLIAGTGRRCLREQARCNTQGEYKQSESGHNDKT